MSVDAWRAWLARPDCLSALEAAARFIYRRAAGLSLPAELLPCPDLGRLADAERLECVAALANELWLFLRTRPDEWFRKRDWGQSGNRGERLLVLRIAQDFLHDVRDRARTYGHDPRRALYRRLRQVLQADPSIHYRATPGRAYYSLAADAPELTGRPDAEEPYSKWDSPLDRVPLRDLGRREGLLAVARAFWEQTAARTGHGCFIPIRELVGYICAHYGELGRVETVSLDSQDDGQADPPGEGHGGCRQDEEAGATRALVQPRLRELARKMTSGWSPKQRQAFWLIQGKDLTLEKAAVRMGYRGASGVSYLYHAALQQMRDFCHLWPGLSPPDLDERLFEAFVLEVLEICKTEEEGRRR